MRKLLEEKFFPHVVRPGRYSGGEPGQVVKDPTGRTSYLHAYADKYEIGQSYVGLQTLYHVVNADDCFLCERVFAVDTDAEELMRREKIELFSLETSRPVRQFDALGFTLVDEMIATNLLTMIDLAGIALRSDQRVESDPIIMAGGPAVYNPEPFAPFIDVFFIGDAEEGLPEILGIIHEMKNSSRDERLEAIARRVESVYVPRYYDDAARPTVDFVPARIKARTVCDLKPEYYPTHPIVPLIETVHNHLGVEIMRGCPQGCLFCFAGPIYRPVRPRSVADISAQVMTQLDNSGYDAVSLLSLSATDFPGLEELVTQMSKQLEPRRVSLSLPSLRPGSISPELLKSIKAVRKSGLTIAPEAGTERLRLLIRKDFPDQAIYDTARVAFSNGWTSIKLYFMVGLPTETEEDLKGIGNICRQVLQIGREQTNKASINVTLSPFVPKPHTPFQWDEVVAEEEIFRRITLVKRNTPSGRINFRHNNSQMAMLSALIGRNGREMADVIETAFKLGCRFDSWGENFAFDKWLAALAKHGIDPAERMKPIPFSQRLPWAHIDKGPSAEHLQTQRHKTSRQLRPFTPRHQPESNDASTGNEQLGFGRSKKKIAAKNQIAPTKNRVRLRWGKSDRYRYMSHLDNLHTLERALRRAKLPVAYSQGHNPTMKLSLGPPLPHGFTSEAEYLDVTLETNLMPSMVDNLKAVLPDGLNILDARASLAKKTSLSAALNRAEYTVPVDLWDDPGALAEQIDAVLKMDRIECQRGVEAKAKTVNIRPAIYELNLRDDKFILLLGLGEGGYAKPIEVIKLLVHGLGVEPIALPYHRRALYRVDDFGQRIEAMDI